jgi:hypothetical protein
LRAATARTRLARAPAVARAAALATGMGVWESNFAPLA